MELSFILNYRRIGRYGLNAVAGAVESCADLSEVKIVLATSREEFAGALAEAVVAGRTAVAGWSFYSPGFLESALELDAVRAAVESNRIIHLVGGPHATAEPEQTLKAGYDLVALGEGEQIITDLLRALQRDEDWRGVRGLAWIEEGALRRNGLGDAVNLNEWLPFPVRHRKAGPIEITRGCLFACSFCQTPFVNRARFRHRSVEGTCEQVRIQRSRNLRHMRFITPTSLSYGSQDETVNLAAVEELLARVREATGPGGQVFYGTFPSEVRPEHVTPRALMLLKRFVDNSNLIIGGQSGSDSVLNRINRGHDVESVRRAVHLCLEHGFIPNVDFLFGLPGETEEERALTRQFAEELAGYGAQIHSHTFMPLPGTPLRDAGAGSVDEETRRVLGRLEAKHRAWGQWRKQADVSMALARMRSSRQT